MQTTHSFYLGEIGRFRYLFFAIFADYTDFRRPFIREFRDVYLEKLARDLGTSGKVVQPFEGDIEATRHDVASKEWTAQELDQVSRSPSLLVISKDFEEFSPRTDPWLVLHFSEREFG